MKIGILGCRGIPNHYGGFEQFAQYLSAGLNGRGHDVWVYNSHRHPYQESSWNGVHIIHCNDPEYKYGTAGQFIYDRNCIHDARSRQFDVLLHLGYTSDSLWHRRWPRTAVNMVNMDGLEWKRKKYNWLTRGFLKRAEKLAALHGDVLVADSLAIQEHIKLNYGKEASFIPYAAEVFLNPVAGSLNRFQLKPHQYYMLMGRMVPENNIETIIKGYLLAENKYPLLVIGDMNNRFGKYIQNRYCQPGIIYAGPLFDMEILNNLRFYSGIYFHGHSVGGTNPSLLEAMACGCRIAAHRNMFNESVLGINADYFLDEKEVAMLLRSESPAGLVEINCQANLEKVRTIYHPDKIIEAYETLMLQSLRR